MDLSNAELICLNYLESVERDEGLPDGCDIEALVRSGLIERVKEQWLLTLPVVRVWPSCGTAHWLEPAIGLAPAERQQPVVLALNHAIALAAPRR